MLSNMDERGLKAIFECNRSMLTYHKEIPVTIFQTFLGVALWGYKENQGSPITILELSERIGSNYQTVSRHLRYLGDVSNRKPGLGLVKTERWPDDERQKTISLTPKGETIADHLGQLARGGLS